MAAIKWPGDIKQCFRLDYSEDQQSVVIRSPVDVGPHKVRRRYTKAVVGIAAVIVLDKDELAKFRAFYNTTLQGGVLPFEVTLPTKTAPEDVRFLQPFSVAAITDKHFNVGLALETIT